MIVHMHKIKKNSIDWYCQFDKNLRLKIRFGIECKLKGTQKNILNIS